MVNDTLHEGPARADALGLVLALLIALFGILSLQQKTTASVGLDFYQFWAFGERLAAGPVENLYSDATSASVASETARRISGPDGSERARRAARWSRRIYEHGVEPISTPWYYAVFAALSSGDYDRDLLRFQVLSNALLLLCVLALCRALGFGWTATGLALAFLALAFRPLAADVEAGNVNRLQCALLLLSVLIWHHGSGRAAWLASGALLSMTVVFKPSVAFAPAFLLVVWIANRRLEKLVASGIGLVLGGLATVLASFLAFGSVDCWLQWLEALREFHSSPLPMKHLNLGTARLIYEWTGVDVSLPLTALLAASFPACAWLGRRPSAARHRALGEDLLAVGAGALLPLIGSQLAWDHYYLLALPLLLYLLRPGSGCGRRALAAAALWICAQLPLRLLLPIGSAQQLAAFLAVGTLALWILLLEALARPRGPVESAVGLPGSPGVEYSRTDPGR